MRQTPDEKRSQPMSKRKLLAVLAGITALGPFAMHLYLPALPELAHEFGVDQAAVQLTISLYVLSMASFIPFIGPLADQYGRRPVLVISLLAFLIGSLGGWIAWDIHSLIAARIVQGAGGASGLILARSIISDLFDRERMAQLLAQLVLVMVIAPTVAPTVGALVIQWVGWRPLFAVLTLASLAVLVVAMRFLPETLEHRQAFSTAKLRSGFAAVLKRPAFIGYTLQSGFSLSAFFAFVATAPYIMVDVLKRPTSDFGLYFLFLAGGYATGSFVATRFAPRLGGRRLMMLGSVVSLLGAAVLMVSTSLGAWAPVALFGPMALTVMGSGMVNPHAQASAIKQAPEYAGTASSASSFVQQVMGALAIQFVGLIGTRSPEPVARSIFVFALGATLCVFWAIAREHRAD